ncbi:MAG TPA: metallophosphoesterase, partial [Phnomibacter sp.]|nr:metallophosphoesterase [Phnomibacter sp.]
IPIYGGIVIRVPVEGGEHIDVFCTHGHQGDAQSDGNWLSAAFVTYIWGPLQAFLRININSPSSMIANKTLHNRMMYEWSASKENVVLITGHTHQPVFNSLTRLERLHILIAEARQAGNETLLHQYLNELPERQRELPVVSEDFLTMKPSYFNTGCCCFSNGTISGIEAHEGMLRLVLWKYKDGVPTRVVAEETSLMDLGRKIMRQG